jgi:outer membrane protein OmpA-like peptidoglycan-associated protein
LIDKNENIIDELTADSSGKFKFKLKKLDSYQIKSIKTGFTDGAVTLNTNKLVNKVQYFVPVYQTALDINIGETYVLKDIYYDFDKSNIRADAEIVLNKLLLIMENNPTLKIELSSHTDSRGRDVYNLLLSNRRAKEAVNYIIKKGISSERIIAKGYGESKLTNRCSNGIKCSIAEHQANRRTVITILDI